MFFPSFKIVSLGALLLPLTHAEKSPWLNKTLNIGYVIFPGYEPLDVYGPLEILYELSGLYPMTLSMVGPTLGPQSARPPLATADMIGPQTVATHTFDTAPPLDVIIVPGGGGLDKYEADNNTIIEDFLRARNESTSYILSVCTGAVTLAKAGLLKGKKATTNKAAFIYVADPKHGTGIEWVPSARWVANGHIWTSSGVAAGMDMMYAFLKHLYGEEGEANLGFVMDLIEYAPHTDPHWDPFSVVWKVPGANMSQPLADCAAPVGHADATSATAAKVQSLAEKKSWNGVGGLA